MNESRRVTGRGSAGRTGGARSHSALLLLLLLLLVVVVVCGGGGGGGGGGGDGRRQAVKTPQPLFQSFQSSPHALPVCARACVLWTLSWAFVLCMRGHACMLPYAGMVVVALSVAQQRQAGPPCDGHEWRKPLKLCMRRVQVEHPRRAAWRRLAAAQPALDEHQQAWRRAARHWHLHAASTRAMLGRVSAGSLCMRMRADHVGIGELAKVVVWGTACEHAFDEIDERLPGGCRGPEAVRSFIGGMACNSKRSTV